MGKKFFSVLLLISLIFPITFLYFHLFPSEIISTEKAFSQLGEDLKKRATEKNLRGYILSVEKIHGIQSEEIEKLLPDINAVLFAYKKWKIFVGEKEREDIKKKINIYIKRWSSLIGPDSFSRLIQKEAKISASLKYYPQVFCEAIPGKNKLYSLTLDIIDFATKQKILSVSTKFTKPEFYTRVEKRQKVLKFGTYISLGVLSLSLLTLIFIYLREYTKRRRIERDLPQILKRLENYFNQGHFVAAQKLVCQCISLLPENTDLLAFKERLEDYCGGDPKKAQIAYVEMLKLKKRINNFNQNQPLFLEEKEKKQINALMPYCQELKITYEEYLRKTSEQRKNRERQAEELFENAKDALKSKKVDEALKLLSETLELHPELKSISDLLGKIKKAKSTDTLRLVPEKIGKEIVITKKDVIIIGREKADVKILNPLISRQHLKIILVANKVIVEDLNSKNGTFYGGEKINKMEITNGVVLSLARSCRLVFHICGKIEEKIISHQTITQGQEKPVSLQKEDFAGVYIETEKKDILLVRKSLPVEFKTTGIVYEHNGRYRIELSEDVFFLTSNFETKPLFPEERIEEGDLIYRVL